MSQSFFVRAACPKCKHSLMDHVVYIRYKPSIRVQIESQGNRYTTHLCSEYSCHDKICEHPIPEGETNDFFCPYCLISLKGTDHCALCSAPMITLEMEKGGRVVFCSRNGCKGEYLAFDGVTDALLNFRINNAQETGEYH